MFGLRYLGLLLTIGAFLTLVNTAGMSAPPRDQNVTLGQRDVVITCTVSGSWGEEDVLSWSREERGGEQLLWSTFGSASEESISNSTSGAFPTRHVSVRGRYNLLIAEVTVDDLGIYHCDLLSNGTATRKTALLSQAQDAAVEQQVQGGHAESFLRRYGYLGDNATEYEMTGRGYHGYTEALRLYQNTMGFPVTGELDDATESEMRKPRCGVSDKGLIGSLLYSADTRKYRVLGTKWHKSELTYRITQYTPDLTRSDVDATIERAFQYWSDVTPLTFRRSGFGYTPDIEIRFLSGLHAEEVGRDDWFDGPSGVLAHAFHPPYGDVHFDEAETWTINTYRGINLLDVATHEFGHSLGLDHSRDRSAIMYPTYSDYNPQITLGTDDITGIQSLYPSSCSSEQFKCDIPHCIPNSNVCDGWDDCEDHSDERNCPSATTTETPTCRADQFTCRNSECIPASYRCDGLYGCDDWSDEDNCAAATTTGSPTCRADQFTCRNSKCIRASYQCDDDNDCGDYSDEEDCARAGCSADEFTCSSSKCIRASYKCDGDNDCGDMSDEQDCTDYATTTTEAPETCRSYEFTCRNFECINAGYKCDGDNDCGDYSDEEGCPVMTTHIWGICGLDQFRCDDGLCIDGGSRCDGFTECADFSDEMNCAYVSTEAPSKCSYDEFTCSNSRCIPANYQCDGDNDCHDFSDERNCTICGDDQFTCRDFAKCIPGSYRCDGANDCGDNSDEELCTTSYLESSSSKSTVDSLLTLPLWIGVFLIFTF